MFSVLANFTDPYSSMEAWIYDAVVGPAIIRTMEAADNNFLKQAFDSCAANASLLDVGCGGGQVVFALQRLFPGFQLTGLDLSADQIRRANRRGKKRGSPRTSFIVGSALSLPFEDGSFDGVVSIASIKHWPDRAQGLEECVRVLKPGGTLLVVEADRGCRYEEARDFIKLCRIPRFLRPVALASFRTWVAGRSLDVSEAESLACKLALEKTKVGPVPGTAALQIFGLKVG